MRRLGFFLILEIVAQPRAFAIQQIAHAVGRREVAAGVGRNRAYDGARNVLFRNGTASPATDVFGELAEHFDAFVELLGAVADQLMARGIASNGGIVKLYERWLRTGSNALGEALVAQGLMPVRAFAGVH